MTQLPPIFAFIDTTTAGGLIVALFGIFKILQLLQGGRAAVSREMRAQAALDEQEAKTRLPQPLIVTPEKRWATEEALEALRKELDALRVENKEDNKALSEQIAALVRLERERTGNLHDRIDRVAEGLSGLQQVSAASREDLQLIKQLLMSRPIERRGE